MKFGRFMGIALVLAASTALVTAQTGTPPKQEPAKQDPAKQGEAKPVPAAAPISKSANKVEIAVPVQGLTQENASKVKGDLEKLEASVYACGACKAEYEKAGDCCKAALKPVKAPILARVAPAADNTAITVQTNEGMQLKLSEIERALSANSVKIDKTKMTIPSQATLVVSGATSAEQGTAIQKALDESKAFQRVNVKVDDASKRAMIHVTAAATPATRAKLEEALAKAGGSYKLEDVIWNSWSAPEGTK
jgi:hypothetical protein